jgi:hypothetical protein
MLIQAPIELQVRIGITDGDTQGVATLSIGRGSYPTEAEMREAVEAFAANAQMPAGYRVMTKREWWDYICEQEVGQKFALPGGPEFDA